MRKTLVLDPLPLPLTRLENGTLRVTGTRIPLERIIDCHKAGETPESIVDSFDTLRLADVYLLIGFYLDHKEQVEDYVQAQEKAAEEIRKKIEAVMPPRPGLKEELLARKARMESPNAEAGN